MRFLVETDALPGGEGGDFEVRLSHRRSSSSKQDILPMRSIGPSCPIRPMVSFQVEHVAKTREKTLSLSEFLKQTASDWSLQDLNEGLSRKNLSKIIDMALLSEEDSAQCKSLGRFVGEMWQEGSSRLTATEIYTAPVEESESACGTYSRAALFGDLSWPSMGDIWPWPWLPPTLNSSEYISAHAQPTTFSFQNQLQMYPVLPLSHTLKEYLNAVKIFVKPEHLSNLKKILEDLEKTKGENFYNEIIIESSTINLSDSLAMYWLPRIVSRVERCLTRLEAPLVNGGILASAMWDLWPAREDSQLERAIILIQLCADFARLVYSERLSVFHDESGFPLCNHQFRMLFSSCKIPGIPSDATHGFFKTIFESGHRWSPRHIIVICRGQLFRLNILLEEFNTISTGELSDCLERILDMANKNVPAESSGIGILTATDRDTWSETRMNIMELSENNRECLQIIEEAMFVLTLEHLKCRGPDRLVSEALFADGCNRWYDKGLSFYMYKNGLVTVNLCLSIVDYSIVNSLLRFIHSRILEDSEKWDDEVLRNSGLASRCVSTELSMCRSKTLSQISELVLLQETTSFFSFPPDELVVLRPLVFDIDNSLAKSISDAKISFVHLSECLSSSLCDFSGFDMSLIADLKIHVDAFAQLALQLTFLKMYFRPPAVGSQVSIRRFYHAHYETMMTTTEESLAWGYAMLKPHIPIEDKKKLFFSAARKHAQRLEVVHSGFGCYHQMSALREIAFATGDSKAISVHETLAAQPAGSPESVDISCEGCCTNDCLNVPVVAPPSTPSYGVGYVLAKSRALFTVCSFKTCTSTCAENFSGILKVCLNECQELLRQA